MNTSHFWWWNVNIETNRHFVIKNLIDSRRFGRCLHQIFSFLSVYYGFKITLLMEEYIFDQHRRRRVNFTESWIRTHHLLTVNMLTIGLWVLTVFFLFFSLFNFHFVSLNCFKDIFCWTLRFCCLSWGHFIVFFVLFV